MQQFKSGFKRTFNWNEYQLKVTIQEWNQYLSYLVDPTFQKVNWLFVLSFENKFDRTSYNWYFPLRLEIKYYNVMIKRQNFFDQLVKNNSRTYCNIRNIAIGQRDDNTNVCWIIPIWKNIINNSNKF